jgi:hypothetical protein
MSHGRTFLVFPKSTEQILWESIRHELSRQYVVPEHMSAADMAEFIVKLSGVKLHTVGVSYEGS